DLTGNRTFGEYAGGFLERSRRNKRLGGQRSLGDTQQYALAFGCDLGAVLQFLVFAEERRVLNLIARDKGAVAVFGDHHFTQHLTHNDFDVRSEEHTSELQSRENLVCRLLL